jgi:hypothetical protein
MAAVTGQADLFAVIGFEDDHACSFGLMVGGENEKARPIKDRAEVGEGS